MDEGYQPIKQLEGGFPFGMICVVIRTSRWSWKANTSTEAPTARRREW